MNSNNTLLPDISQCPAGCPGCRIMLMTPEECLAEKLRYLHNTLAPWQDKIHRIETPPPGMQWGYRSRVCLAASHTGSGWHLGLKKHGRVLPVHDCHIHSPIVRKATNLFVNIMPPPACFPLAFYVQSGAQVTLVVKTRDLPDMGWLDSDILNQLAGIGIEGVWINLHPSAGRRVFAKSGWHLVWGLPVSCDGKGLLYGPSTFRQVAGSVWEKALNRAEDFLAPTPEDLVIDLYCGTGATLARWIKKSSKVVGIEICRESVKCAALNAPGATILQGMCAQRIPQLEKKISYPHAHRLLYANPPGTGIEHEVIDWITSKCRPERVAYLSCNVATAKRDIMALARAGYCAEHIIPYDFFPNTRHLECLILLCIR